MNILILLGAGASIESGIPTFDGFGSDFNIKNAKFFNHDYVINNKIESKAYFNNLKKLFKRAKKNQYHYFFDKLIKDANNLTFISQNIDLLDSNYKNVIKLHGNLFKYKCINQQYHNLYINKHTKLCPICFEPLLPDILYYGENYSLQSKIGINKILLKDYDYFIIIGSSLKIGFINKIIKKVKSNKKININPDINISKKLINFENYVSLNDFLEKNKDYFN